LKRGNKPSQVKVEKVIFFTRFNYPKLTLSIVVCTFIFGT